MFWGSVEEPEPVSYSLQVKHAIENALEASRDVYVNLIVQTRQSAGPVLVQAEEYYALALETLAEHLAPVWEIIGPYLGPVLAKVQEHHHQAVALILYLMAGATAVLWIVKISEWMDPEKSFPKKKPRDANANVSVGLKKIQEETGGADAAKSEGKVISALQWSEFILDKVQQVSPDTKLFVFKLPKPTDTLGIPVGRHISVRAVVDGETVVRPYTPVSLPTEQGHVDLLIKMYDMGKMSRYFHGLIVGDRVEMRGPVGRLKYTPNKYSEILLVGAGSGITPLLQVARAVLSNPDDATLVKLIYQNRTNEDILLKDTLDELSKTHSSQLCVRYCLSKPDRDFGNNSPVENRGYCDCALLKSVTDSKGDAAKRCAMLCGPDGFNKAMKAELQSIGIEENQVIIF